MMIYDDRNTLRFSPVAEIVEEGHTVNKRRRQSKEDSKASPLSTRKGRNARMTKTKAVDVDAPTDVNKVVRISNTKPAGRSLAQAKSGSAHNADVPVYFRIRLLQATGDIDADSDGELVPKTPSEPVAVVAGEDALPVQSEVPSSGSRSYASEVLGSNKKDADMHALCSHIQDRQAENED